MSSTTPAQRSLWWEERVRQEEKSLIKLVRACKKHASARVAAGEDDEAAQRRQKHRELARGLRQKEKELASERVATFKATGEVRELAAMVEKLDERLADPSVVNAHRHTGSGTAAALGQCK